VVGLYFTGVQARSFDRPEYRNYSDPHIRFREVVFFNNHVYRYIQADSESPWRAESVPNVDDIVREFCEDEFLHKAGIGA
jgi:hypothetical protein